jgi:aspartate aminotransferase
MFETLQMAPPDAILGLTEAFRKDPHPRKINLSVGVYQDAGGKTPILNVVREAEKRLLAEEASKNYLGIDGLPEYAGQVRDLLLGSDHDIVTRQRAVTAQTPGGTGALRVAGDFLRQKAGCTRIWCSDPTWANHASVFQAAGLEVRDYPYIDASGTKLDFDAMMATLAKIPAGDAACLHACCHNPTGIDPTVEQWQQIGTVLQQRGVLPLVDFAYQGFAEGLAEDAAGLKALLAVTPEALVCSSFSKNFGLYGERVGAMTLVADSADNAQKGLSHVKVCIRTNYSNPPKHGAAIVAIVLSDSTLRGQWTQEVAAMRNRIAGMRRLFVDTLRATGVDRDFSFITRQRGMFSFSGISPQQVDALRSEYSIYLVRSGRINVAGMTPDNMDRLCEAIATVLTRSGT